MVFSCAIAKVDDVIRKPLQDVLDLISEAKQRVMGDDYRDLIEVNGDGVLSKCDCTFEPPEIL